MSVPFDLTWRPTPETLDAPLRWRKPRRVAVDDLFHGSFSDEFIAAAFGVMAACPQHTFAIATDHAERMREWFASLPSGGLIWSRLLNGIQQLDTYRPALRRAFESSLDARAGELAWPLPNVWLGVRITDQATADARIPHLLSTPAAVRFVEVVPTGAVDLRRIRRPGSNPAAPAVCSLTGGWMVPRNDGSHRQEPRVHWVVVSGESGPAAQPCDVEWIRGIVGQCRAAAVPVFVRNLGSNIRDRNDAGFDAESETWADGPLAGRPTNPSAWPMPRDVEFDVNGYREEYQGAPVRVHLVDPNGADPDEWPDDLRVRELPR